MSSQDKAMENIGAVLAIGTILLFMYVISYSLLNISGNSECEIETESLPFPNDVPLLTNEEKAMARESGFGAYKYGDMYYVNGQLPDEYYREDI